MNPLLRNVPRWVILAMMAAHLGCLQSPEKGPGDSSIAGGMENRGAPMMGLVKVTEVNKTRIHHFDFYSRDGDMSLHGNFSIGGESYPGRLLYDGNRSVLFRPTPDQAIVYPVPDRVIYGFLPPTAIPEFQGGTVEVLETSSDGVPLHYIITTPEQISEVEFTALEEVDSLPPGVFELPDDTTYLTPDDVTYRIS